MNAGPRQHQESNGLKNKLQSVHPDLHPVLINFTREMKSEFGVNLFALVLYGSAAGKNYVPKRSNINLLMVLREFRLAHLLQFKKKAEFWRKKQIVPPLICSREFLVQSKEVFPIEWLEMMHHHLLLDGENPFGFTIDLKDVRLQCEREIKGNQIRLRQAFLEIKDRPREIGNLALASLNSLFPVLRNLLILKGENNPPVEREKLIAAFCEKNHFSPVPFRMIWSIKLGQSYPLAPMMACFESYFSNLEIISKSIDQLDLK